MPVLSSQSSRLSHHHPDHWGSAGWFHIYCQALPREKENRDNALLSHEDTSHRKQVCHQCCLCQQFSGSNIEQNPTQVYQIHQDLLFAITNVAGSCNIILFSYLNLCSQADITSISILHNDHHSHFLGFFVFFFPFLHCLHFTQG